MSPVPPPIESLRDLIEAGDGDGTLRIVYLDRDGAIIHDVRLEEKLTRTDPLLERYLVGLVADVGAPAAVVTVTRRSGRPTRADRTLWRAVSEQSGRSGCRLIQLVVIGAERHWSAVSDRPPSARTGASRVAAR